MTTFDHSELRTSRVSHAKTAEAGSPGGSDNLGAALRHEAVTGPLDGIVHPILHVLGQIVPLVSS